jgi:hypothetical protein
MKTRPLQASLRIIQALTPNVGNVNERHCHRCEWNLLLVGIRRLLRNAEQHRRT